MDEARGGRRLAREVEKEGRLTTYMHTCIHIYSINATLCHQGIKINWAILVAGNIGATGLIRVIGPGLP